MKNLIYLILALILIITTSYSSVCFARGGGRHSYRSASSSRSNSSHARVSGYTRRNGKYVAPYRRTRANSSKLDNFSSKGNVNPYTGKVGTKNEN